MPNICLRGLLLAARLGSFFIKIAQEVTQLATPDK